MASSNSSPAISTKASIQSPTPLTSFQQSQQYFSNNNTSFINTESTTKNLETKILSPTTTVNVKPLPNRAFAVVQELQQHQQTQKLQKQRQDNDTVLSPMQQIRSQLMLPLQTDSNPLNSETVTTPNSAAQTPISSSRSKQGSPFYAEPADALGNVIRRSQRNMVLPATQRYSEPGKGPSRFGAGVGVPFCQVLSPIESEKSPISGSLDELKKKNQRKARGRMDPWPLDSSWEFMGTEGDDNDYDTDANWKTDNSHHQHLLPQTSDLMHRIQQQPPQQSAAVKSQAQPNDTKNLTVQQIILKRMPELNFPDFVKCIPPPSSSIEMIENTPPRGEAFTSTIKSNRISSYDNVERAHSGYASSIMCYESTHSDDGTVFSEPWDSSQWDSFLPHDGTKKKYHIFNVYP